MRSALRGKCVALVAPNAAREAISFITREGAIRSLIEEDRFSSVRYCLFHPASLVWKPDLRSDLLDSIQRGQKEFAVYVNVRDYFKLLAQGLKRGMDSITQQEISALLKDGEFVRSVWDTVTSRSIQYRMRIAFIRDRESLIRNGASESDLPLTTELQARLDEELAARGQVSTGPEAAEAPASIEPARQLGDSTEP